MKTLKLFRGGGPLVALTSYAPATDPGLLAELWAQALAARQQTRPRRGDLARAWSSRSPLQARARAIGLAAVILGNLQTTALAEQSASLPELAPLLESLGFDPKQARSLALSFEFAYDPPEANIANPNLRETDQAFDLWGRSISGQEAAEMRRQDPAALAPANGAVEITDGLVDLGRRAFYRETFGNEHYFSDIVGADSGVISGLDLLRASLARMGEPTGDLRVAVPESVTVGGRTFEAGTEIHTGLDLPRGAVWPLGLKIFYQNGRTRIGFTCSLCHAAVEPRSGHVIHGVPNVDLNLGLLLAFASNSAAFFTHTGIDLGAVPRDEQRRVTTSDGRSVALPDPRALEEIVDERLLGAVPGSTDTSVDMVSNPTQIPDSFTFGEHPFSWNGRFMAGPFRGLSALSNNVHTVGADPSNQTDDAERLLGLDPEVYLGIILQNAADLEFRLNLAGGQKPSEVFADADPTPGRPGVAEIVPLPNHPRPSLITSDGTVVSSPGSTVWREINAMAAWQDRLIPPASPVEITAQAAALGRAVFERAGCAGCHSGKTLTNHRIVPLPELGTNPSRAQLRPAAELDKPLIYSFDTPVPLPADPKVLTVPTDGLDPEQVALALAAEGSPGGYAVPGLLGLYWSPPYLHDGGAAVGADPTLQLGMPGTLLAGIMPDARNSLRALVDRDLRERVVAANHASAALRRFNVEGVGHEFWVDAAAGFSAAEQDALLGYLLALPLREEMAAPAGTP